MLVLWLPVVGSVLFSLVSLVGDQNIVKEVALVHGPDFDRHSPNVTQVVERVLVLKVVWVGNLAWLPDTLQDISLQVGMQSYPQCSVTFALCLYLHVDSASTGDRVAQAAMPSQLKQPPHMTYNLLMQIMFGNSNAAVLNQACTFG